MMTLAAKDVKEGKGGSFVAEANRRRFPVFSTAKESPTMISMEDGPMSHSPPTVAALCPNLTPEQALEAEDNLERYLELALRIYERVCADPEAYAQFKNLTESRRAPKMIPASGSPAISK